jgi:hypothetical protein
MRPLCHNHAWTVGLIRWFHVWAKRIIAQLIRWLSSLHFSYKKKRLIVNVTYMKARWCIIVLYHKESMYRVLHYLLCRSKFWTVRERDINRIVSAAVRYLRSAKGSTRLDHIKNGGIEKGMKMQSLQHKTNEHRQN